MKKFKLLLLDANVVIKVFELGICSRRAQEPCNNGVFQT
jgi:hypothetical protein